MNYPMTPPTALLKQLVQLPCVAIALMDIEDLTLLFVTDAAAHLVMTAPAELVGRSFLDIVEPRYHQEVRDTLPRLVSGNSEVEDFVRMVRRDGSPVYAEVRAAPLEVNGRACLAAFLSDATERHEMQQEMSFSEERFRAVFQSSRDGLLVADPKTRRFVLANETICRMLGYGRDELLTLGVEQIHPPAELPKVLATFEAHARGEFALGPDLPVLCKDGSILYAEIYAQALTISGRDLLLSTFRDVTERRRLMAGLAQTDRMASLGLLAAGVAHEINNPLTYVLNCVDSLVALLPELEQALRSPGPAPLSILETAGELMVRAKEAAQGLEQVNSIVQDLKRFSRVEEDTREPVQINAVLEGAVNMAFNQIKYRARLVRDLGQVPAVIANEGRLSQVFLNLMVNAAHAIPSGDAEGNSITVRSWAEGDYVHVTIQDSGRGIDPADLEKLFDPFFTTRKGGSGSGLGLSICRSIVIEHGGTIEVESSLGEGSRFLVRFPVFTANPPLPKRAKNLTPVGLKFQTQRALIVDDEPRVAATFQRILSRQMETELVLSAREAFKLMEQGERFDVIICDLMMPEMTGMDLHASVQELDPEQADRMIFVTGGVFTTQAEKFLNEIENMWLEKPFTPSKLRQAVRSILTCGESSS